MSLAAELTRLASGAARSLEEDMEIEGVGRVTVKSTILPSESVAAAELSTKRGGVDAAVVDWEGFVVLLEVKAAKPSSPEAGEALRSYVLALQRALAQTVNEPRRLAELTDRLGPAFDPPSVPMLLQARRNTEARKDLLFEFGALTAAQLTEARQASRANPSALASRWRKEGRIFGVTHRDETEREKTYFPGFQFDDRLQPLEVVGRVLAIFATHPLTEWEVALWFTTPNGWLDDRRPVDLLHDDPDAVVASAEHEVAAIAG